MRQRPVRLHAVRWAWRTLPALLLLCFTGPLGAAAPEREALNVKRFTCPLSGQPFSQAVGYPTFPLVTFPDGSYPGDERVNTQVPACPADGLVLLPDFSPPEGDEPISDTLAYPPYSKAELAKLPALVADPAYAALKGDGRYAQAYWIATQLGRPAFDRFSMLQRATWGTTDPALRRKLVEQLVSEGPALIEAADKPASNKRYMRAQIANALRELGRFDEARALAVQIGAEVAKSFASDNPDEMIDADPGTAELIAVIDAHDADRYPIGLMPSKWANVVCSDKDMPPPYTRTETAKAACARRDAERNRAEREDEQAFAELNVWRGDPAGLDKACTATPEEKRSKGLQMSCEAVQSKRDQIAAVTMVKDGPKVATACEAVREDQLDGALRNACLSYDMVLESELGRVLASDDLAWSIICPQGENEGISIPGRWHTASGGCLHARQTRKDKAVEAMLADPAKIDATCAATPEEQMHGLLFSACLERGSRRRTETIERLATVPADFDRTCARFAKTNASGNDVFVEQGEQDTCRSAWRLRANTQAMAQAEAKGLKCFGGAVYGPERPRCVSPAQFEKEMAPGPENPFLADNNMDYFAQDSSLRLAARTRAAAIIAKAKADGTFPKKRPGDRY